MNEFLEQFLIESRELVQQATADLLAFEQDPQSRDRLDGAFRAFHTLKGGAGIVDFTAMARAVHAAEDALSAVRAGSREISPQLVSHCLKCIDQVSAWLDQMQSRGALPDADVDADLIVALFKGESDAPESRAPAKVLQASTSNLSATGQLLLAEQVKILLEMPTEGRDGRMASVARLAINVLRRLGDADAAEHINHALAASHESKDPTGLIQAIELALQTNEQSEPAVLPPTKEELTNLTLRVDAERVSRLVTLTGELMVAKNGLGHLARSAALENNPIAVNVHKEHTRLNRLITELQHAVLKLRVLPLRNVFQRFTRVVREMSVELEKPTTLRVTGDDTEADKAIVEMLFEPLLHVVRNAMGHGIEQSDERAAAGKAAIATIDLRAHRSGEHVVIEIADDGRGIDVARVRAVALERGILEADVLSTLSDQDAIDLIFAPGFSTARDVTALSGRGVGMDAVRTAVERIGGRVTVDSVPGKGCTVTFILPFSVMMTRVMTAEAGGQMFGIPLESVQETLRLPLDRVQGIGTAGAFVLRNQTVPLLDLGKELGHAAAEPASAEEILVVVASVAGHLGGLKVDRIGDRMEIMLKPTEGLLSGIPGLAGTTLTGDGQVLLVLDLQQLFF